LAGQGRAPGGRAAGQRPAHPRRPDGQRPALGAGPAPPAQRVHRGRRAALGGAGRADGGARLAAQPPAHRRRDDRGHGIRPRTVVPVLYGRSGRHRLLRTTRLLVVARGARRLTARRASVHCGHTPVGRCFTVTLSDPDLDVYLHDSDRIEALRADARAGLTASPKWLPPKYFYDARGSELFEEITRLPEYYPTRA